MSSHDRTLVQSLMLDTDRKTPEHDQICTYLTKPDVICALLSATVAKKSLERDREKGDDVKWWGHIIPPVIDVLPAQLTIKKMARETMITKGTGQYQTLIGFADIIAAYEVSVTGRWRVREQPQPKYNRVAVTQPSLQHYDEVKAINDAALLAAEDALRSMDQETMYALSFDELARTLTFKSGVALIEVKSKLVSVADAVRQLKLYCRYNHNLTDLILASPSDVTTDDMSFLNSEGIIYVKVSKAYMEKSSVIASSVVTI